MPVPQRRVTSFHEALHPLRNALYQVQRRKCDGEAVRFADALAAPGFGAIAEFKRRSPSAGDLRPGGDVAEVARRYERRRRAGDVGARRRAVRRHVGRPARGAGGDVAAAARQGVLLDARGLRTAREAGADAALLILRDLDDARPARG